MSLLRGLRAKSARDEMRTCLVEGCTNQTNYKLCTAHWYKLDIKLRERWWSETDFGRHPPGEDLMKAVNENLKVKRD